MQETEGFFGDDVIVFYQQGGQRFLKDCIKRPAWAQIGIAIRVDSNREFTLYLIQTGIAIRVDSNREFTLYLIQTGIAIRVDSNREFTLYLIQTGIAIRVDSNREFTLNLVQTGFFIRFEALVYLELVQTYYYHYPSDPNDSIGRPDHFLIFTLTCKTR